MVSANRNALLFMEEGKKLLNLGKPFWIFSTRPYLSLDGLSQAKIKFKDHLPDSRPAFNLKPNHMLSGDISFYVLSILYPIIENVGNINHVQ